MSFIEVKANSKSIAKRRPVHGHGINNANYITNPKINGRTVVCPYYRKWSGILERCFSKAYKEKNETYKDVIICSEWLLFSNFKEWMKTQDWEGKEIDKDLLVSGNKTYSPELCVFLPTRINKLITDKSSSNGVFPTGVCLHKQSGKFRARCLNGKGSRVCLGLFSSPDEAFESYKKFKYQVIKSVAENEKEPIKSALLRYEIK